MKCKICNREFKNYVSLGNHISRTHKISTKEYYDKFLKKENEGICSECGRGTNLEGLRNGYRKFCSNKCTYNSKEIKEKRKQTSLERYGVEHPFQNGGIKEKYIQTCLEKYGVNYSCQIEGTKEKIKQTCLKKYGVENPSQTQEARERMKNGGSVHASSFIKNPSKPQVELFDLVKSLHEETILNFPTKGKSGKCYSLDIAIPSLMVDIEYDGSYWHQNKEQDQKRQEDLEESGWKFLRYRDRIPLLEDLKIDLSCIFGD